MFLLCMINCSSIGLIYAAKNEIVANIDQIAYLHEDGNIIFYCVVVNWIVFLWFTSSYTLP